jgi:hypothetical protein
LQVEHALDLQGRRRVLFVDASLDAPAPCSLARIEAARDDSFTTHAMSPQAVLKVFADIDDGAAAAGWLLAIRGERFELGEPPSDAAQQSLRAWHFCSLPTGSPLGGYRLLQTVNMRGFNLVTAWTLLAAGTKLVFDGLTG